MDDVRVDEGGEVRSEELDDVVDPCQCIGCCFA